MKFQIPDEALDQLRSLLEAEGGIQWEVGDFLVAYWEEMLKYLRPGEVSDAHAQLIRDFAKGTGADKSTLRDRKQMSMFFTKADRAGFPMFTYHQFGALRRAGEDWGQYAWIAADEGWSVARIRKEIDKDMNPQPEYTRRLEKMGLLAEKILADEDVPLEVREGVELVTTILLDIKDVTHEQVQA